MKRSIIRVVVGLRSGGKAESKPPSPSVAFQESGRPAEGAPVKGLVWMQPWLKLPGLDFACRLPGCCLVGTLGCTCLARLPGAVAGCQAWEIERLGGQLTCLVLMTLVNTDGLSSLLTFPLSSPLPLSWCTVYYLACKTYYY